MSTPHTPVDAAWGACGTFRKQPTHAPASDRDLPLLDLIRHNAPNITTIGFLWMREDPSVARVGEINLCPYAS